MSDSIERPDLTPDDATPRGYIRIAGFGLVHKSLFVGAVLVAVLVWRARTKGK